MNSPTLPPGPAASPAQKSRQRRPRARWRPNWPRIGALALNFGLWAMLAFGLALLRNGLS